MDRILEKVELGKFITTALKSILKLVKLVAKCCKMRNIYMGNEEYSPAKFANFVHFCITHGKLIPFSRCWYRFSVRNIIQKYTKFAIFTGLHFRDFTTFRNETLQFY